VTDWKNAAVRFRVTLTPYPMKILTPFRVVLAVSLFLSGCTTQVTQTPAVEAAFDPDAIRIPAEGDFPGEGWIGYAVAYSGFREGQDPNGAMPSTAQIREDLHLLDPGFSYIRTYAAARPDTHEVLRIIREDELNLKVVLGAWLHCEDPRHAAYEPRHAALNDEEIEAAISLARAYPDVVVGITVGNEILVDWSFWPVPLPRVIELVRRVQDATGLPVSVADDYSAWASPEGVELSRVVDFVFLHAHPIWHKKSIEDGFPAFLDMFRQVREAVGPDQRLIVGETGWATFTTPAQTETLHAPDAGSEESQEVFWHQLHDWAIREGVPVFWFSAFDEPWKDASGTEGFWGLYRVDRSPRQVLQGNPVPPK